MAKQSLESWIREALSDLDKEGTCSALALEHVMANGSRTEVHTVRLSGRQWKPEDLAQLFQHKADSYAQELPGVQSFCMMAFYGDRTTPEARHPFRVTGELEYNSGLATEGPTETGARAQQMRLTEAIVQGAFGMVKVAFENQNRSVEQLSRENAHLRNQNVEYFNMAKDLMVEQSKGDHEFRLKEISAQERAKLFGYIPALANTVFGKEIFPQSTADTAIIEQLLVALTPEKVKALAAILPPKVWMALASRLEELTSQQSSQRKGIEPEFSSPAQLAPNGKGQEH